MAFIVFGALTLAAAPAHADTGEVGYAEAHIADEADIRLFGPRAADFHGTYRYLDIYKNEIFADSRTFIKVDVDTDELISRVLFEELRVELTEGDIEAMREAAVDGLSQPGLENPEGSSEDPVLQVSFTGTVIEANRNWAGDEEFTHDPGESSIEVNELGAEFSFVTDSSPWEESIEGTPLWGSHHSLDLIVDFPEEGFSVTYDVGDAWVAGDLPPAEDGGDEDDGDDETEGGNEGDTGGEDGGEGDTDPEESGGSGDEGDRDGQDEQDGSAPEKDTDSPVDEKPGKDDDLARTGVPVLGLIAAGTAIAAGGGATAYLARRRKNSAPEKATSAEG